MTEIPDDDRAMVAEIDSIIDRINLEHDVFISALFFGKDELVEGPMSKGFLIEQGRRERITPY